MSRAINASREARLLHPFIKDPRLSIAASTLATRLSRLGVSGPAPSSEQFCAVVEEAGFPCFSTLNVTATGNLDIDAVVQDFFSDRRTRDAIQTKVHRYVGIGHAVREDRQYGALDTWVVIIGDPPEPAPRDWRRQILAEVNQFRGLYGLKPLSLSPLLNDAAQRHADDMAYQDYVAHNGRDGRGPGQRATDSGYRWRLILENLAAGQATPEQAVQGWKDSDGHRRAMLNGDVTEAGIGYRFLPSDQGQVRSFHYWALSMGLPK